MGTILDLTMGALQALPGKKATSRESVEPSPDRKTLELELEAVRRKELELLRAIAITDHPGLAEALAALDACLANVMRLEQRLATGLSGAELQRRDSLVDALGRLAEKRAQLDVQIASYESELRALSEERAARLLEERRDASRELAATLATHESLLERAGVDMELLLPGITARLSVAFDEGDESDAALVLEDELESSDGATRSSQPPALP